MSQSLKSGFGTRTVIVWPESAVKLVGLNQVWKLCRLTLVSIRARMRSQMVASMAVYPRNQVVGRFETLPLRFVYACHAPTPIFRALAGVATSKVALLRPFLAITSARGRFSTVFSTGVENWGNKPNAHGRAWPRREFATVPQARKDGPHLQSRSMKLSVARNSLRLSASSPQPAERAKRYLDDWFVDTLLPAFLVLKVRPVKIPEHT